MPELFYVEIFPKEGKFEDKDAVSFHSVMKNHYYATGAPLLWDAGGYGHEFGVAGHVQFTIRLIEERFLIAVWPHFFLFPMWAPKGLHRWINKQFARWAAKNLFKHLEKHGFNPILNHGDIY